MNDLFVSSVFGRAGDLLARPFLCKARGYHRVTKRDFCFPVPGDTMVLEIMEKCFYLGKEAFLMRLLWSGPVMALLSLHLELHWGTMVTIAGKSSLRKREKAAS